MLRIANNGKCVGTLHNFQGLRIGHCSRSIRPLLCLDQLVSELLPLLTRKIVLHALQESPHFGSNMRSLE